MFSSFLPEIIDSEKMTDTNISDSSQKTNNDKTLHIADRGNENKVKECYVGSYKKNKPLDKRIEESKRLKDKYPDRIAIICETSEKDFKLDKVKYLVPLDLRLDQFIAIIRKRIQLSSDEALFLFCRNTLPMTSNTVIELYKQHADEDGFLYFHICKESTFG